MCGILGGTGFGHRSQSEIQRHLETLRHRGPDNQGIWIGEDSHLAMTRLSIIDIEGGHQPVFSRDKTIVSVFNGEIYNYRELREMLVDRGIPLASNSDSEVIPHLYEIHGERFIDLIDGMFAIAIYDLNNRKLLLYRDRLGEKPIWYKVNKSEMSFASEIKTLLVDEGRPDVDIGKITEFLNFGYFLGTSSPFKGIKKLEAGHYLSYKEGKFSVIKYWEPRLDLFSVERPTFNEAIDILEAKIKESVRLRLNSDRPTGIFLSGGIDSSLVAYFAQQSSGERVKTYSLGFTEVAYSETHHAAKVAKEIGSDHYEYKLDLKDAILFDKIVSITDIPFADSSFIPTFHLCNLASSSATVFLSGDGGDEGFAGYDRYRIGVQLSRISFMLPKIDLAKRIYSKSRRKQKLFRSLSKMSIRDRHMQANYLIPPTLLARLATTSFQSALADYDNSREGIWLDAGDKLQRMQLWDLKNYLSGDLLYKMDMASMANSIEVRAPLLDHKLVEFGLSLPTSYKLKKNTNKFILRELAYRKIPKTLLDRPKMGFAIPRAEWLRTGLQNRTSEILLSEGAWVHGIIDSAELAKIVKMHNEGWDLDEVIWPLLILESWAQRWNLS